MEERGYIHMNDIKEKIDRQIEIYMKIRNENENGCFRKWLKASHYVEALTVMRSELIWEEPEEKF